MMLSYQTTKDGDNWETIGTVELVGGKVERHLPEWCAAADGPVYDPVSGRLVDEEEGEAYMAALEQHGGSSRSRFVLEDMGDAPEEGQA